MIAVAVGLLLAATVLVAPAVPAQAATGSGTLTVKPGQFISAKFSGIKLDSKRVVVLERSTDQATWTKVTEKKMSSKGAVTFATIAGDAYSYRATAKAFTYTVKKKKYIDPAVSTPVVQLEPDWAEEFNSSLDLNTWRHRDEVGFKAKGRRCSAPVPANTTVAGGVATLKMTEVKDAQVKAQAIADAKAAQRADAGSKYDAAEKKVATAQAGLDKAKAMKNKTKTEKKKRAAAIKKAEKTLKSARDARAKLTPGCPKGVYYNAMISTLDTPNGYSTQAGTVVARVKFSQRQGAHSGIWLKDGAKEIDLIEAFGYGRGISNIVWRPSGDRFVKDPLSDKAGYVAVKTVAKKSWWSNWHTVAVTTTDSGIVFYVDGVKTKTLKKMDGDFSIVVSTLSSDWETYRVKQPDSRPGSGVKKSTVSKSKTLPSMQVDWIRSWEG